MVSKMCKPFCPSAVHMFIALYEGPYPEGPGSFEQCGGTAAACLQKAGFSAGDTGLIMQCYNDDAAAAIALQRAEVQTWPKFKDGKGFPQVYINGTYLANGEGVLPALCAFFASANFPEGLPEACGTFDFLVNLKLHWPLDKIDRRGLDTVFEVVLDLVMTHLLGGSTVVSTTKSCKLGTPVAVGDSVEVPVKCSTFSSFQPQALSAPSTALFASWLASQLKRFSSFKNITAAEISASAVPQPPQHHEFVV